MIPDYQCNAVYFSEWLKNDYPDIYHGLARILNRHNVAMTSFQTQRMSGAGTICRYSLIKIDTYAMNTSQIT